MASAKSCTDTRSKWRPSSRASISAKRECFSISRFSRACCGKWSRDLDHKYINDIPFFKERASSSEYLAFYIYGRLAELAGIESVAVKEVRVWESDNACAAYRE